MPKYLWGFYLSYIFYVVVIFLSAMTMTVENAVGEWYDHFMRSAVAWIASPPDSPIDRLMRLSREQRRECLLLLEHRQPSLFAFLFFRLVIWNNEKGWREEAPHLSYEDYGVKGDNWDDLFGGALTEFCKDSAFLKRMKEREEDPGKPLVAGLPEEQDILRVIHRHGQSGGVLNAIGAL